MSSRRYFQLYSNYFELKKGVMPTPKRHSIYLCLSNRLKMSKDCIRIFKHNIYVQIAIYMSNYCNIYVHSLQNIHQCRPPCFCLVQPLSPSRDTGQLKFCISLHADMYVEIATAICMSKITLKRGNIKRNPMAPYIDLDIYFVNYGRIYCN